MTMRSIRDARLALEDKTAVERFDCETYMFWAAALMDPCSEMAIRYLSCCNVIDCFLFSVVKTQYSILYMVLDY